MKKVVSILFSLAVSMAALAVPASPYPFTVTQPDGTELTVRLVGDEFHHYLINAEGQAIARNAEGFYQVNEELALEGPAIRKARRVAQATQAGGNFPTTGSPKSLVILIGFADLPFGNTNVAFNDLLNKEGYSYNGATGSARDYFKASSMGKFAPQFDVYGPYVASHNMAYYGENTSGNHSSHESELIIEACRAAHDAGVNLGNYDTDGDGILDNVFVYFAGHNEAEHAPAETIWPHQSNLSGRDIVIDGVRLASYACTSEYSGASGTSRCGIGTFCHEFGHVIGLPDFYDTDYKYYSVAEWDIMSSGSYNNNGRTPPTYTAYERFFEGWLTPEQLSTPGMYTLSPIETSNQTYMIAANTHNMNGKSPNPSEFFLLEYRDGKGWDIGLAGHGMLVWHIDYSSSAWSGNTPNNGPNLMRMHLEEANGVGWKQRGNKESGRASDPYPGTMNVTTFTPKLHNGTALDQPIFDIKEEGGVITFVYKSLGESTLVTDVDHLDLETTVDDYNKIVSWTPQQFTLDGGHLMPGESVRLTTTGLFYLYVGETAPVRASSAWKQEVSIVVPEDSAIHANVWVSFRPTKRNCSAVSNVITIKSVGGILSLPVTGVAPRHTYVTTPVVKDATDVTPYSFRINWKPVKDAEEYYITVYSVEPGTSSFTQGFENFSSEASIKQEGWQSNTHLTTTSAKSDGTKALYLKNTGDYIISETYQSAITNVSYWVNAFTADVDTVGSILVEAYNGKAWTEITTSFITSKTKKKTISHDFESSSNYVQFRVTYTDFGGSGVAFDAFTATCSEKIAYLYKGTDLAIAAIDDEELTICYVKELQPATTYYYQVQASDLDKGCEEHLTDLSAPKSVTTIAGLSAEDKHLTIAIDSINYNPTCHAIYVPAPVGGDFLYFYDMQGHKVYEIAVHSGEFSYQLPLDKFNKGYMYAVKLVSKKMNRKGQWAKFIYK